MKLSLLPAAAALFAVVIAAPSPAGGEKEARQRGSYTHMFAGPNAIVEAANYIRLDFPVANEADCAQRCNANGSCRFYNSYLRIVDGESKNRKMRCALFRGCHNTRALTKTKGWEGGERVTYAESKGMCKR